MKNKYFLYFLYRFIQSTHYLNVQIKILYKKNPLLLLNKGFYRYFFYSNSYLGAQMVYLLASAFPKLLSEPARGLITRALPVFKLTAVHVKTLPE